MRYLIVSCDIITKDEINFINLETVALETARNMLQNPEFKTQMDY